MRRLRIYSFPKAGRTWLTYLWYFYALDVVDKNHLFDRWLDELRNPDGGRWRFVFPERSRDFVEQVVPELERLGVSPLHFLHGPHEDDSGALAAKIAKKAAKTKKPYAVIIRNPARVLVSYYHHIVGWGNKRYDLSLLPDLSTLIRCDRYGLPALSRYYASFPQDDLRFVLRYETLRSDTAGHFESLLRHFAIEPNRSAIAYAVKMAALEKLKAIERIRLDAIGLQPGRDHLQFREGRLDSPRELSDTDLAFLNSYPVCPLLASYRMASGCEVEPRHPV